VKILADVKETRRKMRFGGLGIVTVRTAHTSCKKRSSVSHPIAESSKNPRHEVLGALTASPPLTAQPTQPAETWSVNTPANLS